MHFKILSSSKLKKFNLSLNQYFQENEVLHPVMKKVLVSLIILPQLENTIALYSMKR